MLEDMEKDLEILQATELYDTDKLVCSLTHLTHQLVYFYNCVVNEKNTPDKTVYRLKNRPKEHQLVYFNIGRGFPKELMDGHWCYILKMYATKAIVIPTTSIKIDSKINDEYEMDIKSDFNGKHILSRLQLSDIRSVDLQRIDERKQFLDVLTEKNMIKSFLQEKLI